MEKRNGKALLPIFVFVVLYLGLGILFEYGLRIEMGFYKIPVVVIFLIALLVACLQNRALQLNDKLAVMGTGISDPNIITMILIFMLAGIFVGVVGRSSANSVAYFILSLIPPQFAVAVLFIVSCLVSLAMGTGAAGMFETSMVAILVAAICALIKEYGGFAALLHWIKQVFKGRRGGLLGMGLLVGLMDIATANNTVAIVMANPIAKEMSKDYGISSRKAASILDTFSCVFQGILPYGAQMLVAIAAASGLGETVNAFEIMPKLFYPYMLLISSLLFIFFGKEKQK